MGEREECADHTPAPTGYLAWHDWARKMGKTHRSTKCPDCRLYKIWVPKSARPTEEPQR